MTSIVLHTLPAFGARAASRDLPLSPIAQRLVAFLALRERPVSRAGAAEALWCERGEEQAAASLRTTLWRIGRVHRGLVTATSEELSLADTVAVDFRTAVDLARSLTAGNGTMPADNGQIIGLLSTDLLPTWYDDWLVAVRERWRQLRLHALECLAERLARQGRFAPAVEAGLAAIDGEPLRESAHRSLIRVHLLEGNHGEAVRTYRALARLLRVELGVVPSASVRLLIEQTRRAC